MTYHHHVPAAWPVVSRVPEASAQVLQLRQRNQGAHCDEEHGEQREEVSHVPRLQHGQPGRRVRVGDDVAVLYVREVGGGGDEAGRRVVLLLRVEAAIL